jgi:hypothetical protein
MSDNGEHLVRPRPERPLWMLVVVIAVFGPIGAFVLGRLQDERFDLYGFAVRTVFYWALMTFVSLVVRYSMRRPPTADGDHRREP